MKSNMDTRGELWSGGSRWREPSFPVLLTVQASWWEEIRIGARDWATWIFILILIPRSSLMLASPFIFWVSVFQNSGTYSCLNHLLFVKLKQQCEWKYWAPVIYHCMTYNDDMVLILNRASIFHIYKSIADTYRQRQINRWESLSPISLQGNCWGMWSFRLQILELLFGFLLFNLQGIYFLSVSWSHI